MMDATALSLWQALAYQTVWRLAATTSAFSSDEVWATLEPLPTPDDPRALGPVLTRCAKDRLIRKSDMVVKSGRRACHGRPINVWISVVRSGNDVDAAAFVAGRRSTLAAPLLFDLPDRENSSSIND